MIGHRNVKIGEQLRTPDGNGIITNVGQRYLTLRMTTGAFKKWKIDYSYEEVTYKLTAESSEEASA